MSFRPFVRQLGYQPGVQLNPLADLTDGVSPDNADQILAVVARLTRGRIDRPFRVNRSNFLAKTGPAESIRANALNEAKLQTYEALNNGGYEAVVMRLAPVEAVKSYAVINFGGTPVGSATTTEFVVSATAPLTSWSLYLMHHDCHNDGIKWALHADQTPLGGVAVANTEVKLRLYDALDVLLHEFTGSLSADAKDDYGQSLYLPDVIARQTDSVSAVVSSDASVPVTSDAYGRDANGRDKWATSPVLICFSEGGTSYDATDYDRCITALRETNDGFGYLLTGGTQVVSLIGKLALLAIEANLHLKVDIPGALSPSAAISLAQSLNLDSHYVHFYWSPLEADDPLNGGRAMWGTGGLNAGFSCARNAQRNAKGFAPKNYPVAGKGWTIGRTGIRQLYSPTEQELSDLAKMQINPVIYELYNGGGRFVFTDSLTSAKTRVSFKKLISVAEMSADLDNWVTLYAKELLQLPMRQFIKRMNVFLDLVLSGAESSGWLVPAKNLPGNAAFSFEVKPSEVRPADLVLINYYTSFDGVARQVIVQQTLTN